MKEQFPVRNFDCPKYSDCLGTAIEANERFSCDGCKNFSKWPYGKKIETRANGKDGAGNKPIGEETGVRGVIDSYRMIKSVEPRGISFLAPAIKTLKHLDGCTKREVEKIMVEETRVCTNPKCTKPNPQPIGEYNKNAARPSGRESRCRTCTAQAQRDWVAKKKKTEGDGQYKITPPGVRSTSTANKSKMLKNYEETEILKARSHAAESLCGIYLDPAIIKAIQKSAAKQILKDFSEFIEKRYS